MLEDAKPIQAAAEKELQKIKKEELVFLAALPNPPTIIGQTLNAVLALRPFGNEDSEGGIFFHLKKINK